MTNWLLLHGALGSHDQLKPLEKILHDRGFRVHGLNFSGHGGQPFAEAFGIEQFAEETGGYIKSNGDGPVSIFGYSMGGYVATWLALHHPELVSRIVTLGTKFDWNKESAEREIRKMDPDKIELRVPAFARVLEHRHKPNDWKLMMKKTSEMMSQLGKSPLLNESNLKNIQIKVKVALGDQDDMADSSFSMQVAEWLPQGEYVGLPGTPHPLEKVDLRKLSDLILN